MKRPIHSPHALPPSLTASGCDSAAVICNPRGAFIAAAAHGRAAADISPSLPSPLMKRGWLSVFAAASYRAIKAAQGQGAPRICWSKFEGLMTLSPR